VISGTVGAPRDIQFSWRLLFLIRKFAQTPSVSATNPD